MVIMLPYPSMRYAIPSLCCLLLLLAGCAGRAPAGAPPSVQTPVAPTRSATVGTAPDLQAQQELDALVAQVMSEAPPPPLLMSLEAQHEDWKGVPYRYGGLSPRGVDCSGFVYLTFQSRLGMEVPRTTLELLKSGKKVKRGDIRVGDLVFFRTGPGNRHVGIYMGGDEFMHASVSKGVMQSSLHNPYWSQQIGRASCRERV